jgi:hypothetical protein
MVWNESETTQNQPKNIVRRTLFRRRTVSQREIQSEMLAIDFGRDDALVEHIQKLANRNWADQRIKARIEDRIRELHIDAIRDGDRFSEASLIDLRAF